VISESGLAERPILAARVLVQIPDPRRHSVRYYGFYSNAARGKRKKAAATAEASSPGEAGRRWSVGCTKSTLSCVLAAEARCGWSSRYTPCRLWPAPLDRPMLSTHTARKGNGVGSARDVFTRGWGAHLSPGPCARWHQAGRTPPRGAQLGRSAGRRERESARAAAGPSPNASSSPSDVDAVGVGPPRLAALVRASGGARSLVPPFRRLERRSGAWRPLASVADPRRARRRPRSRWRTSCAG
jgi:hypothetical protein